MLYYTRSEAKKAVGAGWSSLIDEAYNKLETMNPQPLVDVVKVKYGGLRIGAESFDSELTRFLWEIEDRSLHVCELCGKPGEPAAVNYWVRTLCEDHNKR